MGWNAGQDLVVGTIVTSTKWNSYMGTAGSLEYLKAVDATVSQADGTTVAYSDPPGTRVFTTIYQNTSGKIRTVTITVVNTNSSAGYGYGARADCHSATPPTVYVAYASMAGAVATGGWMGVLTFKVPPNWYYRLIDASGGGGTTGINYWTEWDEH